MRLLLPLFLLVSHVLGQVNVDSPKFGTKYDLSSGTSMITVEWSVSDSPGPKKQEILEYIFTLVSGPNLNIEAFETVGKADAKQVENQKFSFPLRNNVGANGWYYIQVLALTEEGHVIQYSPRFQLTGMVGGRTPQLATDTMTPSREIMLTPNILANMNSMSFSVPYGMQTGLARFAPMQTQPATKVTKKTWSMVYPTSSFTYFKDNKRRGEQLTTVTPGWSYGLPSKWNEAAIAPQPSENGGWYHPSQRLSLTPRKINADERLRLASQ
ncbi:hypothetical protein ZYGR_0H01460 [Zygosaccharomyces rouxii]|uniref:ZYRO0B07392p n=2 Tax=Zygosaccharomyces rouxii TaxID=4956 RepID=C5DRC6_ZYGRC|nr:uncharacterized protein ZYRO0B07392g [Zygosaccharomyces rouxii]KAH9200121.1 cell wall synthesis protein KRE9/KNH1-domain-containing protein [Zygosaccharomyces rouxii]GAV47305.1 hypothetical protein ZYGR_0H01460 [Zygosaccharomyces rouxii]CAR26337.1 ZYRO0B07392p [Zygosaccharomyces rouxii]